MEYTKNIFFFFILFIINLVKSEYIYNALDLKKDDVCYYPLLFEQVYTLFPNKSTILKCFNKIQQDDPWRVGNILKSFNLCFSKEEVIKSYVYTKPFVLIEGNNKMVTKQVSRLVAKKLGAKYAHTPPQCMVGHINSYRYEHIGKTAFYALALYASSYEIKQTLFSGTAVVMNGYWTDQVSVVLLNTFKKSEMPIQGSKVYNPPSDLIAPHSFIYLHTPTTYGDFGLGRSSRLMHRMHEIYSNINITPKTIITTKQNIVDTFNDVYATIQSQIGNKFDLPK